MRAVTKMDGEAQKIISRSLFSCIVTAFSLTLVLLLFWVIRYLILKELEAELIVISCAPALFGVLILIYYLRLLKKADGELSRNEYDFGERTVKVTAIRNGSFAGSAEFDYAEIRKIKRRKKFLLFYVKGMGAFLVDMEELGEEGVRKLADDINAAKGV